MENLITLSLLKSFYPCYEPETIGFIKDLKLTPLEFIEQFVDKVESKEDILWLLCRKEFMTNRDLRLFAVWCAREALKLVEIPDERSINACNIAEKFANEEASQEELTAARTAARDAARTAARTAAMDAARDAARTAAWVAARTAAWAAAMDAARDAARTAARTAAWDAARDAAWAAQINQLKTYFK